MMAVTPLAPAAVGPAYGQGDLLLEVKNLRVSFRTDEGILNVVDGVDFSVRRGRTLGIVGESGSGKSVTTKALMQLLPDNAIVGPDSSVLLYRENGEVVDIARLKPRSREVRRIRGGDIAMIFQEPMSSLSPVYTVGNQIMEAIRTHRPMTKQEAQATAIDLLAKVGIANPEQRFRQYPFELSGGMRQRALIAVALASSPALLIADEPTTALDVTIQAQILDLLRHLQDELHMAVIFITHDLGVISQIADDVAVMYLGQFMEQGRAHDVIFRPQHPYTRSLLRAIPRLDNLGMRLQAISGDIPGPMSRPAGCPFHTRCNEIIRGRCDVIVPRRTALDGDRLVRCLLYEEE